MKDLPPLEQLSDAEKDTLIRALWQRVQELEQRLQALESHQAKPEAKQVKKTSKNSS